MTALNDLSMAVADDSPILADAAARALESAFGLAAGAVASLTPFDDASIRRARPDLLILDPIFAQPLDRLVPTWRAMNPALRLVAFATQPSVELARFCLALGFQGFLPKRADSVTLARAVGVVAKGGSFIDKTFGRSVLSAAQVDPERKPLTVREEFVLRQTAFGYSNREVALELGISPKTVDSHRARGMTKLGLTERSALVRFAAANGWFI